MKSVKKNKDIQIDFKIGMRFEFFYALSNLTNKESRLHQKWRERCWSKLPKAFYVNLEKLGASHLLWPIFSTLIADLSPDCSFEDLSKSIKTLDSSLFQAKVLNGFVHDENKVKLCLEGKLTLRELVGQSKNQKREWLIHVGLYPYSESSGLVQAMEFLISSPVKFQKAVLETMNLFWLHCFEDTWKLIEKSLQKSSNELQEYYNENLDVGLLFEKANVRAIYNDSHNEISALRGGYSVNSSEIKKCFFIPSAFNELGWWSSLDDQYGDKIVFFPFIDQAINVDLSVVQSKQQPGPRLDPFLIFKSLGDPTRFAVIKMISSKPMSSSVIAKKLGLTKATISHHVALLRQSGLINESYSEGQVILSINQRTIEQISDLTCEYLKLNFHFQGKSYGKSL